MLKKNIKKDIEHGINNIILTSNIICFLLSFFYTINNTIFIKNIEANRQILIEQTDFKKEIQNNEIFQKISKLHKHIVIPHIYEEFTNVSSEIIIMDFLESKPIDSINIIENYSKNYIKFSTDSIFVHNTIHADMHKGNILFLKDNNIGILDFGMIITNISNKSCNAAIDLIFSLKNNDINRISTIISKLISDDPNKCLLVKQKMNYIIKSVYNDDRSLFKSDTLIFLLKKIILEIDEIPRELSNMLLAFVSFLNLLLGVFNKDASLSDVCKELIDNIII